MGRTVLPWRVKQSKSGGAMATYRQPCIHCGEYIERDSRFCTKCASRSPFGYQCPFCLKDVERGQAACAGCGKSLMRVCPHCGGLTFAGSERCDLCTRLLMIRCENERCREAQHFERSTCSACCARFSSAF